MIEVNKHGKVLEIVISNPPVNALGAPVRQGLRAAITDAAADDGVAALILRGAGKLFSAGADITEFGKPMVEPSLTGLLNLIEASGKPVVAAIHGMALGGGLELALACHYRVATPSAKLGLPEVKLGLLPGAGGTQRLPRLIGIEHALEMIIGGEAISAARGKELGVIDLLVDDQSVPTEVLDFAKSLTNARRTSEMSAKADPGAIERYMAANGRKIRDLVAPLACIEALKSATELDFATGQQKERALFVELMNGSQSQALRHAFFAERAAAKVDRLPVDIRPRAIQRVGIVGAGTMGGGIAMNFLSTDFQVVIVETNAEALERGIGTIRKNYDALSAKGRLTAEQVGQAMARISTALELEALKDCDLILEAVYENMDVKKEIFRRLDRIAKQGAILASNTSYLDIDQIAASTCRPGDVLGLHFFSPANVMRLVEVVRGAKTTPDVLAAGMDIARKIGKLPVVSRVCYGFIGNRMLSARQTNATRLLLEGATPEQIDRVHADFGMPMGPFQMTDLAGVDIGWHRDSNRVETIREALCAQERWGQKVKAGFYDYDDKRQRSSSPVVARIIDEFRDSAGYIPRAIDGQEIVVRTLYTMVNEGAKILEEGIAQRASDIDVVWLNGYGWPRYTGGPMFWANQIGLMTIVEALRTYQDRLRPDFTLSSLLVDRAEAGERLDI